MIRTLDLEIVRPGPAHNQLLSPLVNYTALCGRDSSVTINVGSEHRAVMEMLRPLQAPEDNPDPQATARAMEALSELLEQVLSPVRGLSRDLNVSPDDWVELRLVLNPMELALLPFELLQTSAARGQLAEALQLGSRNVVLTRGIRGTGRRLPDWPVVPRILFVAASPGSCIPPPVEAHFHALRQALDPWAEPGEDPERSRVPLTTLTNATLEDIRRACEETRFDWVHLLVHGGRTNSGGRDSYGIVLDGPEGPDVVGGAQLAAALTPIRDGRPGIPPTLVTLCTCHSGRATDVVYPGASVAQEVHAYGVPMVVASQFPLTFRGSVILADELYRQLLDDRDPRIAVAACRSRLRQGSTTNRHPDEASLVAYCELGAGHEETQRNLATRRASAMMERGRKWLEAARIEEATARLSASARRIDSIELVLAAEHARAEASARTGATSERVPHMKRVAALATEIGELRGLRGSVCKRRARTFADDETRLKYLREAHDAYERAVRINPSDHWALTQWLTLDLLLAADNGSNTDRRNLAWRNAEASAKREPHLWRYGTLAELYLLAPLLGLPEPVGSSWRTLCLDAVRTLVREHGPSDNPYILAATKGQARNYATWWCKIRETDEKWQTLRKVAEEVEQEFSS